MRINILKVFKYFCFVLNVDLTGTYIEILKKFHPDLILDAMIKSLLF